MEIVTPSSICLILGVVLKMNRREWRDDWARTPDRARDRVQDRETKETRQAEDAECEQRGLGDGSECTIRAE